MQLSKPFQSNLLLNMKYCGSCLGRVRSTMFLFSNCVTYPYDISKTIQAVFSKYPNDFATHVVSVDTLSSNLVEPPVSSSAAVAVAADAASALPVLRFERLICVRQSAPKWVSKVSLAEARCDLTFMCSCLNATRTALWRQLRQLCSRNHVPNVTKCECCLFSNKRKRFLFATAKGTRRPPGQHQSVNTTDRNMR